MQFFFTEIRVKKDKEIYEKARLRCVLTFLLLALSLFQLSEQHIHHKNLLGVSQCGIDEPSTQFFSLSLYIDKAIMHVSLPVTSAHL